MKNEESKLQSALDEILSAYQKGFSEKVYSDENDDHDLLMDVYGITPLLKRENRQYWGRELGMCWQRLVVEICRQTRKDFGPALRLGADEPCDLTVGNLAIDTKYRIGSGDSGTLKKFKAYGPILEEKGFKPVLLIVREDNLGAAITACNTGGWTVTTGQKTFDYLLELTGFDVKAFLHERAQAFPVVR
ncbi:MAG: restriction endonuclease [Betaproteobacteria bacterium]|nr:restriction endonuclease [Betaproteobacteria bacterium]